MIVWMVLDKANGCYYRIRVIHDVLCFQKFYDDSNSWQTWTNIGGLVDFCVNEVDELVVERATE